MDGAGIQGVKQKIRRPATDLRPGSALPPVKPYPTGGSELSDFTIRLVGKHDNTRTECLGIHKSQGCFAAILEKSLADTQNYRKDHQPILVNQIMLPQRMDQIGAATEQNVLTGLLLEPGDFFWYVRPDQRGMAPISFFPARRNNILADAIHPIGKAFFILHV